MRADLSHLSLRNGVVFPAWKMDTRKGRQVHGKNKSAETLVPGWPSAGKKSIPQAVTAITDKTPGSR